MATPKQLLTSKRQDWKTPKNVYDKLNAAFDLQMDPCTDHANHLGCKYFLTENSNGLAQKWLFNCFVNPPFKQTRKWVEHAYNQYLENDTTNVCLIGSRTGTRVWQQTIFPHAKAICFVAKRLRFDDSSSPATFDTAIVVFTPNAVTADQYDCLASFGHVYLKR